MSLVDIHSHFFSAPFFDALAAQSPIAGDLKAKQYAVAAKVGIELPPADLALHLARWIGELDRHGVDHLATFASAPEETAAVGQAATLAKGRLSAFALVNPRVEGASAKVDALLSNGPFQGVLVFPAMHHFRIDGPEAKSLLQVLNQHRAAIFVHCGLLVVKLRDLFELPRTMDLSFANPLSVIPAANAHPDVRFIIPHFGAGFFRETLMAGASCPNVYVDTSSSNGWLATQTPQLTLKQVFEAALDVFGPERVLFGTDSNTFPAGWRVDRYEEQRACVASCGRSASDQERIFGGNARRILKLT